MFRHEQFSGRKSERITKAVQVSDGFHYSLHSFNPVFHVIPLCERILLIENHCDVVKVT